MAGNYRKGESNMAKLGLVRIDDRLIHGQVVTSWINNTQSNKIIIVDDELAKNEFLTNVFVMAAPKGLPVEVKSVDQVAKEWIENEFGSGTVLMLFKKISSLKEAYEKGFRVDYVQIGGLASGPGRKLVVKAIGLSHQDAADLKELNEKGVEVVFQSMPGEKSITIQSVINKCFKDLT